MVALRTLALHAPSSGALAVSHSCRRACAAARPRRVLRAAGGTDEPWLEEQEAEEEEDADAEPPAGGERGEPASPSFVSSRAYNQLVLLMVSNDLETRLQRALNEKQYDKAKLLREQVEEVAALAASEEAAEPSQAAAEATVLARQSRVAVLRSQLAASVAAEDYGAAAKLRDELALAEGALAEAACDAARPPEAAAFALGQRVRHASHGWHALVAGVEARCGEAPGWCGAEEAAAQPKGRDQFHYLLLPDTRAMSGKAVVAYVPESALAGVEAAEGAGAAAIRHPLAGILFLGPDPRGGMIPARCLLERYAQKRRVRIYSKRGFLLKSCCSAHSLSPVAFVAGRVADRTSAGGRGGGGGGGADGCGAGVMRGRGARDAAFMRSTTCSLNSQE